MASVVGLGFVGSAVYKSFSLNGISPLYGYDKYKNTVQGSLQECVKSPLMFLCLPTLYDHDAHEYDKSAIRETLTILCNMNYRGIVIIKSTIEPGTTDAFSGQFPDLCIMHNPEFLSAATAFEDFHNQKHIVLGNGLNSSEEKLRIVHEFYRKYYPDADISVCNALESESMKSYLNCFYSVKIQFFNELFLLCKQQGSNFEIIKDLMLKNRWIHPMHTVVPGHDGLLSYGGACFPKDTNALLQCMKKLGTPHAVLNGCVRERNIMRNEGHLNANV